MKPRLNTGFDAIDGCFSRFALCLLCVCGFGGAQSGNLFLFGFVVRIFSAGNFVFVFLYIFIIFQLWECAPSNL